MYSPKCLFLLQLYHLVPNSRSIWTTMCNTEKRMTELDSHNPTHTSIREHQIFPLLNLNALSWENMAFGHAYCRSCSLHSFAVFGRILEFKNAPGRSHVRQQQNSSHSWDHTSPCIVTDTGFFLQSFTLVL